MPSTQPQLPLPYFYAPTWRVTTWCLLMARPANHRLSTVNTSQPCFLWDLASFGHASDNKHSPLELRQLVLGKRHFCGYEYHYAIQTIKSPNRTLQRLQQFLVRPAQRSDVLQGQLLRPQLVADLTLHK